MSLTLNRSVSRLTRRSAAAGLATVLVFSLASCAGTSEGDSKTGSVTIAYQPGLGYAPLLIAKEQGTLEKALKGKKIIWKQLASGSAIRDGMIANEIQVGAGGIGPFLVGWSSGVDWKVLGALNNMNLRLMVKDPKIQSLRDLAGRGKIAMPAPDSIQAVVLKRAAQKELGKATELDKQIVAMDHPSGVQALLSGQIDGHLTSPPFQDQEAQKGAHALAKSYDYFGEHTFNSVFLRQGYAAKNEEVVKALQQALTDSMHLLNSDQQRAAELLSKESNGKYTQQQMLEQIKAPDVKFTTRPQGFMEFARFMKEIDLIKKTPSNAADLFFPSDLTRGGS